MEAAITVFLRHGFRRVTMQDIADKAGISRPALYLYYPNKEEIFKAAIAYIASENLRQIRQQQPAQPTVEARLRSAFEIWTVGPFCITRHSPDAKDLAEFAHGFAKEAIRPYYAEFEQVLIEILKPLVSLQGRNAALSAEQIAHLLASAVQGFKESASDAAVLRTMIHGMITLTLAALQTETAA